MPRASSRLHLVTLLKQTITGKKNALRQGLPQPRANQREFTGLDFFVTSTLEMGYFHHPIMQYVIFFGRGGGGGSVHKNNTIYLPLGLYHASVNLISIVLTKITPTK